jgi:hypothetical protein
VKLAVLAALLLVASPAIAGDVYVSPTGSDTNACTHSRPCLTLARAQVAARAAIAAGLNSDLRVYLLRGTYRITSPITLGALDSGSSSHAVVWTSYNGEAAVISGGAPITGWTQHSGGIYKAQTALPAFRSLYVNGKHATRARGASNPEGWTRTAAGWTAPDASMATWGNKTSVTIASTCWWSLDYNRVSTVVGDAVTMQDPAWTIQSAIRVGYGCQATPAWVENALELLDSAGEWYQDVVGGYVYYWPTRSLATSIVIAPVATQLIVLNGASNITFSDLTFAHTNFSAIESEYGYIGLQSGDSFVNYTGTFVDANYRTQPGAIDVVDSDNITIARSTILHTGSRSILVRGGSNGTTISRNVFDDNASGQIQLGVAFEGAGARVVDATVSHNLITESNGFDLWDAGPIYTPFIDQSTISNNEIRGSTWAAIATGFYKDDGAYAVDSVVSNNRLVGSCTFFVDCGAIYNRDPSSVDSDLATGLRINSNDIGGPTLGKACLYLDAYSAYVSSSGNVCRKYPKWLLYPAGSATVSAGPDLSDVEAYTCPNCGITEPTVISAGPQSPGSDAYDVICAAGASGRIGATAGMSPRSGYVTTSEGRRIPFRPCMDLAP